MIAAHDHPTSELMIGCPACIDQTRLAEQTARWEQAPLRAVAFTCEYITPDDDDAGPPQTLTFTLQLKVPADASPDEVDERYADLVGEGFVLALPDTVPMDHTNYAAETMTVTSVDIGPPITDPSARLAETTQAGLFDLRLA